MAQEDYLDATDLLDRAKSYTETDGYHIPLTLRYQGRVVDVIVSTQHPTSSRGLPVVILDGQPHGPGDLPGLVLRLTPRFADPARRAGWTVEEIEYREV